MKGALPLLLAAAALLAACDRMADQPRSKPYRGLPTAASLRPEGTVPRARPAPPPALSLALIERGRERFDINCAPCHGRSGDGRGMIVERGFPAPPSYHIDRLRNAPSQHFYDVITNGYGAMYSYAARVPEPDRWAIVAYIRALQRSQDAELADVPAGKRSTLQ